MVLLRCGVSAFAWWQGLSVRVGGHLLCVGRFFGSWMRMSVRMWALWELSVLGGGLDRVCEGLFFCEQETRTFAPCVDIHYIWCTYKTVCNWYSVYHSLQGLSICRVAQQTLYPRAHFKIDTFFVYLYNPGSILVTPNN